MHVYKNRSYNTKCIWEFDQTSLSGPNVFTDCSRAPTGLSTELTFEDIVTELGSHEEVSPWFAAGATVGISRDRHRWDMLHVLYKA